MAARVPASSCPPDCPPEFSPDLTAEFSAERREAPTDASDSDEDAIKAFAPPRFAALHAALPSERQAISEAAALSPAAALPPDTNAPAAPSPAALPAMGAANSSNAPLFAIAAGLVPPSARSLAKLRQPTPAVGWATYPHVAPLLPMLGDDEPRRRPKTMSRREMLRERRRRERAGELPVEVVYARPQTRADCIDGPRPCLFVACKHHLYLDVNPETGSIKINFPDRDVWELEETCALDVAERGGVTLEEVGDILNLTRERVRQVEVTGLVKLKGGSPSHELDVFVGWDPHPEGS